MANIQKSNPYEQDDPNIESDDYVCTDENPCGLCDICLENENEYIQQMADRFGGTLWK